MTASPILTTSNIMHNKNNSQSGQNDISRRVRHMQSQQWGTQRLKSKNGWVRS